MLISSLILKPAHCAVGSQDATNVNTDRKCGESSFENLILLTAWLFSFPLLTEMQMQNVNLHGFL